MFDQVTIICAYVLDPTIQLSADGTEKFHHLYDRWGAPLLLLASVPVFGSVITVLAGVDGVAMLFLVVLVVISNLVRNWLIIFLSGGVVQLLP